LTAAARLDTSTTHDVAPTKLKAPDAAKPKGPDASAADLSPAFEGAPVDDSSTVDTSKPLSDMGSEDGGLLPTTDVGVDALRGEDGCSFSGPTDDPASAPILALSLLALAAILRARS
jgi:MYXO-CTERM domain-containing protein